MQARYLEVTFPSSKNCFTLKKIIYPLLLPSHNCIIISMFSFQGAFSESLKRFNEVSCFQGTSVNLFVWWRLAGSNRWPPACKAGALPAELNPHIFSSFYQSKAQRSGFRLERRSRLAVKHWTFSSMRPAQGELRRGGGPKWTRTIDLTIISRVL